VDIVCSAVGSDVPYLTRATVQISAPVGRRGVNWTWHTFSVEPVVAVVDPAGSLGVEPLPARLAAFADQIARGVSLLLHESESVDSHTCSH
jgi:hypothetical protein